MKNLICLLFFIVNTHPMEHKIDIPSKSLEDRRLFSPSFYATQRLASTIVDSDYDDQGVCSSNCTERCSKKVQLAIVAGVTTIITGLITALVTIHNCPR